LIATDVSFLLKELSKDISYVPKPPTLVEVYLHDIVHETAIIRSKRKHVANPWNEGGISGGYQGIIFGGGSLGPIVSAKLDGIFQKQT
jgi:hypothetical protein